MKYQGSCHCGGIKFEVEGTLETVMTCNCSICRRKGSMLWFLPRSAMTLLTPESRLSTYRFNKMHIAHRFCATCGIGPFGEGTDPQGNAMVAINARCLDGVDLKALKVVEYDGASA